MGIIDSGIDYTHPDMTDNVWVNEGEIAGDNINLNSLGLISSKVFLDGLTINPSDTGKVEVVPSYKILDGRRYYNYLTD